jgi:hypothetical protein
MREEINSLRYGLTGPVAHRRDPDRAGRWSRR